VIILDTAPSPVSLFILYPAFFILPEEMNSIAIRQNRKKIQY